MSLTFLFLQYEEHDFGSYEAPGSIRAYLAKYKAFSEQYTSMLKTAFTDDSDIATYESVVTLANGFRDMICRLLSIFLQFKRVSFLKRTVFQSQ